MLALGSNARGRAGLLSGLLPQTVFATSLYTGNAGTQTITNGLDMASGSMVWGKARSAANSNEIHDTARGALNRLIPNGTFAEATPAGDVSAFNANGFSLAFNSGNFNSAGVSQVAWSFRRAPKFFDIAPYTGDGTVGRQIPHGLGVVPGMVIIKNRDAATPWPVRHRSLTGSQEVLSLNTTDAVSTSSAAFDTFANAHTATYFAVSSNVQVNSAGVKYVAYLIAHDLDTVNGIVQCGSGTAGVPVALPWPTQWVLAKSTDQASQWIIVDTVRGFGSGNEALLYANLSNAEASADWFDKSGNTFTNTTGLGNNFVWVAIRAPIL